MVLKLMYGVKAEAEADGDEEGVPEAEATRMPAIATRAELDAKGEKRMVVDRIMSKTAEESNRDGVR